MTQEKILEKLGKLKNMADGAAAIGNEQEAQAFAAMLQNLLAKHKLEMTDVEYAQHLKEEPVEEVRCGGGVTWKDGKRVYKKYPDVEVRRRRVAWIEQLAAIIARAHSCEIIVEPGLSLVRFVGRKMDLEVVEFLFVTMQRTAEKLADKEYVKYFYQCKEEGDVTEARGFRPSFLNGFVHRLHERFEEEKRKMEQNNSGTALMRINREALAVRQYLEKARENKQTTAASRVQGTRNHSREGWERGKKMADGLNLKANAVKEGRPNQQLGGAS